MGGTKKRGEDGEKRRGDELVGSRDSASAEQRDFLRQNMGKEGGMEGRHLVCDSDGGQQAGGYLRFRPEERESGGSRLG